MSRLTKFATVNGIDVLLSPGRLGVEPSLHYYDGEELVNLTLSSNEYENGLRTFLLHTGLSGERRKFAEEVMNELADEVEQVGQWTSYKIKEVYYNKLSTTIDELVKAGDY